MRFYIPILIATAAFYFASCDQKPQPEIKVEIQGKFANESEAEAKLKVMLAGDLSTQRQGIKILQTDPSLITPMLSELMKIVITPIDYTYLEEIRRKAQSDPNYSPDDSDPKALELRQKIELRKTALEMAVSINSKEALDAAERYAASENPADANLGKEVLRSYRFKKSADETNLPPAWLGSRQYPANEYAAEVEKGLASTNAAQIENVLNSLNAGISKDQKFPNLAPFIDYFNKTTVKSTSNPQISKTRQSIVGLVGLSEDPRVKPFLSMALNDKDPAVAEAASRALEAFEEWHKSDRN